jgi:hypothetical protein
VNSKPKLAINTEKVHPVAHGGELLLHPRLSLRIDAQPACGFPGPPAQRRPQSVVVDDRCLEVLVERIDHFLEELPALRPREVQEGERSFNRVDGFENEVRVYHLLFLLSLRGVVAI